MSPHHLELSLTTSPTAEEVDGIGRLLSAYNSQFIDDRETRVVLGLKSLDGTLAGGLVAERYWGWLFLKYLALEPELRGQGWGSALLERLESYAREQGLVGIGLDTASFQARPFYQRHGYEVFGELSDYPPGFRRFFMVKRLGH